MHKKEKMNSAEVVDETTEVTTGTTSELLSEEEYEKRRRLKTKEKINKILRVIGLAAVILIAYCGLMDWLFELSWFGLIWDKISGGDQYSVAWSTLIGETPVLVDAVFDDAGNLVSGTPTYLSIIDDRLWFGPWLSKLGATLIFIAIIVICIYLITYYIIDFIQIFKNLYITSKKAVKDLGANVKDTADVEGFSLKKKEKKKDEYVDVVIPEPVEKSLFTEEEKKELAEKVEKSEEIANGKKKRRKENSSTPDDELDDEILDRLLSGETMEEIEKSKTL